jgi:hypothetical protein
LAVLAATKIAPPFVGSLSLTGDAMKAGRQSFQQFGQQKKFI